MRRLILIIPFLLTGCTKSDIYQQTGRQPLAPDRVVITGDLCTDDTGGSKFPVKILFVIDKSQRMFAADPDGYRFSAPNNGLAAFIARHNQLPHIRFGFIELGNQSRVLPVALGQQFYPALDPAINQALIELSQPSGADRDILGALAEIENFIASDIRNSSAGEVLRTRYLTYMLLSGPPNPSKTDDELAKAVINLQEYIYNQGVLEFRLDMGLAYYGPLTIEDSSTGHNCYAPEATDPPCTCGDSIPELTVYCGVYCDITGGSATEASNTTARQQYEHIAYLGGGTFTEFPCSQTIGVPLDTSAGKVDLISKDIVAFNRNVTLTADGPALDSDGDGLIDSVELQIGTDPQNWDSDNDGLGDGLELRSTPKQDPLDPSDRPSSCADPAITASLPDDDLDLLNNCEEGLLSTSPSIPDTDGDGLPDALEYYGSMVPTSSSDRLLDFDADGVTNAVELANHTSPRVNEQTLRASYAYRNSVDFIGKRNVAVMEDSDTLPGVAFRDASPNVVGGQAIMKWDACARTLSWSDARYTLSAPFTPVPTPIENTGVYKLNAERWAEGELIDQIWVTVFVTAELMPSCAEKAEVVIAPLITVSERTCYSVTFSNIKLMQTLASNGPDSEGINHIMVFFTEAPADRLSSPGITKIADISVRLKCKDPNKIDTCSRWPVDGHINIVDSDFVSVLP
ncbi:MAG: VWA domain-containing protein [Deltaproteobacteria bacterium]|nr:VWA domain-containing protein [Deltaproteobacteria bacterium]